VKTGVATIHTLPKVAVPALFRAGSISLSTSFSVRDPRDDIYFTLAYCCWRGESPKDNLGSYTLVPSVLLVITKQKPAEDKRVYPTIYTL
jgi:hypothetical protein